MSTFAAEISLLVERVVTEPLRGEDRAGIILGDERESMDGEEDGDGARFTIVAREVTARGEA